MSKRIAALDLGTNVFHLLIADVKEGFFQKVHEEERPVKLGEGGITEGVIAPAAFDRGLQVMHEFKNIINQYHVSVIKATGTAALRTARNGDDFVGRVKDQTGITVQIIDGDLEADLIYRGVRASVPLKKKERCLIMDIGGGSVEFIIGDAEGIFWKKSFPVGAARLMATFHHSDPISDQEKKNIYDYLDEELAELKEKSGFYTPRQLIGSAGAFETFTALVGNRFKYQKQVLLKDYFVYKTRELKQILEEIIGSNHKEREQSSLIVPVRTDMIVVASVLTDYILGTLNLPLTGMSRFALKEGLLLTEF